MNYITETEGSNSFNLCKMTSLCIWYNSLVSFQNLIAQFSQLKPITNLKIRNCKSVTPTLAYMISYIELNLNRIFAQFQIDLYKKKISNLLIIFYDCNKSYALSIWGGSFEKTRWRLCTIGEDLEPLWQLDVTGITSIVCTFFICSCVVWAFFLLSQ